MLQDKFKHTNKNVRYWHTIIYKTYLATPLHIYILQKIYLNYWIIFTRYTFNFLVDPETGKKIRGQKCEVRDYDQFVFDIYAKYIPQPVEIKTQDSVYDHYDILEEIGTGAFGVVSKL